MASDEYYDDYFDDEGRTWPLRLAGLAAVAAGVFAFVWFGLLADGGNGGDVQQFASTTDRSQSVDDTETTTTDADLSESDDVAVDDALDDPPVTVDDVDNVDDADDAGAESAATPTSTEVPVDTLPDPTAPIAAPNDDPTPAPVEASYETLPDGSPVPVLAIYDGELITLSGTVPSDSAAQRLRVLALANSTVPDAEVASFLAIEPTVPIGVGVRVIEMNSARFPEGSPTISAEHALQLDRIVSVMNALPNITVVVIGHADQRGDDETNFALSAERARAAADYVSSSGVDPSRLSSRGAGESDLLTLNNDEAALALNRRTEFVFYGLLLEAPEPT